MYSADSNCPPVQDLPFIDLGLQSPPGTGLVCHCLVPCGVLEGESFPVRKARDELKLLGSAPVVLLCCRGQDLSSQPIGVDGSRCHHCCPAV